MFFDTLLSKTVNRIKADPNYTENINPVVQRTNKNYIIITPFIGKNDIFFKVKKHIRHEMEVGGYDYVHFKDRERYLQINTDGSINILDKNLNQKDESITDYLFGEEAFNLKDKWLTAGAGDFKYMKHEHDFSEVFTLYLHQEKEKMEVILYIDRKAEIYIRVTTYYKDSFGSGMSSIQYDVPRNRADSINFNYQALVTYFLERRIEEAEAAKRERDTKRNVPS